MPAKKKRLISAEDLYRFQLPGDARIAPDGSQVVYTLQRIDKKTEKKYSNLWRVPTGRGAPRQFTYGDQNDSYPRWSPDSKQIAFLSNRGDPDQSQIYLIPIDGGEARPLTEFKGVIDDFVWAPDGKSLACSLLKKDAEQLAREEDEQKKKLGVVARHYTTTNYKHDGTGYLSQEKWHIWTVNARTGKATQLTDGDKHEDSPVWSPDGQWLAFMSNRHDTPDLEPDKTDLFVMPAAGGEMRRIPTPVGPKFLPAFSPDGQQIAYLGVEGEGVWWRNVDLWVVPTDGSSPARNLTHAADLCILNLTLGDHGDGGMEPPTWSKDGRFLTFQVSRHGNTSLMRVDIDSGTINPIIDKPGTVGTFTYDDQESKLAYLFADITHPSELYLCNLHSGKERQRTRHNTRWLNRIDLGQMEEVWFSARDGYQLQGWILKPPGFDPNKKYPSILEIHGGPQVQYGRNFMHEFYFLAAQGYVVYFSNPRGGQGYGEAHCKAIWNNWGTVDFEDVMDWAAYMQAQPYIDPERMGVTGGSYGGYMTNMIIGRSQQFKAAVTQRSVSNLISMWGTSDGNWIFQQTFGENKPPFANLDKYWQQSPLKYIGNAQTPTLVIHSEQDLRANQEQGEQIYVALKRLGVDTELVLFPGSPHGLSRMGRTDRRIARLNHILRWFDKYL